MKMPKAFSFSPFILPRDIPHITNAHGIGMKMPEAFSKEMALHFHCACMCLDRDYGIFWYFALRCGQD